MARRQEGDGGGGDKVCASPLFSSWRRYTVGGKGERTKGEKMETLGIRRPGKIPSTIRTFNRALRGKKRAGMATLNRVSSTARMHLSRFASQLLRHLSAISFFPRFFFLFVSSRQQRRTNYLYARGSRSFPENVYFSK